MIRLLLLAALAATAVAQPRSGYQDAGPSVRAMQDDDDANPAFFWIAQGRSLWSEPAGRAGESCAGCHGEVAAMRGAAARHPAYDPATGRVLTLEARIQRCRTERQHAPPLAPESDALLALAALVGLQSRGLPLRVDTGGPARGAYEAGERLFHLRQGQLDLSCANCHDTLAGQRLGGAAIPQGHPNGYPIYRLEWQGMGSLARRIRSCTAGVRAEPIEGDELAALALYLAARAGGLKVETPAVRP